MTDIHPIDPVRTRPATVAVTAAARALALLGALALAGCASLDEPQPQRAAGPQLSAEVDPDGSVRADTDDARVAQLWSASEQAYVSGEETLALEHLFNALELDPQNPVLWSRAAEIQLDGGEPSLAETFAIKSNAFAPDNRGLLYRNWLIIENARSQRGDLLGVRSAHKQVQQYRYR